jgi:hypothetical protein
VVGDQLLDPSIASADWIMVGVLVLVMIPFIVILGYATRGLYPLSSAVYERRQITSRKGNLAVRRNSSGMRRLK